MRFYVVAIIYLCFADLTFIFTPMSNVDVISVVDEGSKGGGKGAAKKGKGAAKHSRDDDDDDCTCFFSEHVFFVAFFVCLFPSFFFLCIFRFPFFNVFCRVSITMRFYVVHNTSMFR